VEWPGVDPGEHGGFGIDGPFVSMGLLDMLVFILEADWAAINFNSYKNVL
jgi:hypothetical protein